MEKALACKSKKRTTPVWCRPHALPCLSQKSTYVLAKPMHQTDGLAEADQIGSARILFDPLLWLSLISCFCCPSFLLCRFCPWSMITHNINNWSFLVQGFFYMRWNNKFFKIICLWIKLNFIIINFFMILIFKNFI